MRSAEGARSITLARPERQEQPTRRQHPGAPSGAPARRTGGTVPAGAAPPVRRFRSPARAPPAAKRGPDRGATCPRTRESTSHRGEPRRDVPAVVRRTGGTVPAGATPPSDASSVRPAHHGRPSADQARRNVPSHKRKRVAPRRSVARRAHGWAEDGRTGGTVPAGGAPPFPRSRRPGGRRRGGTAASPRHDLPPHNGKHVAPRRTAARGASRCAPPRQRRAVRRRNRHRVDRRRNRRRVNAGATARTSAPARRGQRAARRRRRRRSRLIRVAQVGPS